MGRQLFLCDFVQLVGVRQGPWSHVQFLVLYLEAVQNPLSTQPLCASGIRDSSLRLVWVVTGLFPAGSAPNGAPLAAWLSPTSAACRPPSLCLFSTPASGWVASLGLRVDIPLPIQDLHPMGAVGASGSKTWGNHIASLLWYRSSLAGVGQPGRWCFPRAWAKLCVLPPPPSYFLSVSTWKI